MVQSSLSGDEIRQLRHLLNLSQEALARELGVSLETVNRWENGRSRPGPAAQRALLSNYESQLRQLLGPEVDRTGPSRSLQSSPRKRILVIDNDDRVVDAIIRVLLESRQDYVIELSNDGLDAAMKAITFEPDLIVMDVNLPGLSGLELCERLRHHKKTRTIEIVAMAIEPTAALRAGLARLGVEVLLKKPPAPDAFIETVHGLLAPQAPAA